DCAACGIGSRSSNPADPQIQQILKSARSSNPADPQIRQILKSGRSSNQILKSSNAHILKCHLILPLMRSLRYAIRFLISRPGFTSVLVLTLALGIGVNSAIFTVVHAVLLKPLPFPDPDRVVLLVERTERLPLLSTIWQHYEAW